MNKSWLQSLTEAYLSEKSLEDLARKHDVSVKSLEKQLEMGIEVEKEHTSDEDEARKIALDHLEEVPEYYSKLKKYVEPKKVDENMSYTNHWTQIIRQLVNESHTREELMKLSDDKLKDLHKEYSAKDDEDSQKEAEQIKKILDSRGDDKEEVKEAARIGAPNYAALVNAPYRDRKIIDETPEERKEREEKARKAAKEKNEKSGTVSESKIKDTVKKLIKKGKKAATKVGKTLIDNRNSDYLSRDIKY